jgi:DNA helicase-2/ATP-dependent DNA helicase PcrA
MKDITERLNSEQMKAVLHRDGPLLVLAGAGSGKTRVVTVRIAHLIESGVEPSQILGLTFTNKAAAEMKERVQHLCRQRVLICTFHSLGVRILRESAESLGFSRNFVIYDEEDSYKIIRQAMAEMGMKEKKGDVRSIKSLFSKVKNELAQDDFFSEDLGQDLSRLFLIYQNKLKECEALDFDDLLFLTVKLFREHPDKLEKYQNLWPYILIDEYQDTNEAQYQLVRMLADKSGNIFAVGDPDQSIYSWRGAQVSNILNFKKEFPLAEVVRLEENFRSHEIILEAANALIAHNKNRFEKNLWSRKTEGSKIRRFTGYDERDEAVYVAREIDKNYANDVSYKDMVIFYRTNAQSRPFEDVLLSRGIPYKIIGGISFYQRKEIKDILAYLRIISSPSDFVSFVRTVNLPKRGIGEATIDKITSHASLEKLPLISYIDALVHGAPLENPLKLSGKILQGLKDYVEAIRSLRELSQTGTIFELVKETINRTQYLAYLKEEERENYIDKKENLDELISKAHEYEELAESPSLSKFLEELTLKSSADENVSEESLSLMTLHNGKGLEFTTAFITGLEEELFPHVNSYKDPQAIEEERRLFYVGMTRAKENLYLSHCHIRFLWGIQRSQTPSRFLREIPDDYITKVRS